MGSPAWFAWLADDAARSFSFRSPAGAYTARKERRQRGGAYWVAYRTAAGRQHKVYLGRGEELTPERLAEAAATLAGRITDAGPCAAGRVDPGTGGLLLATKLFVPRPRPDLVPRPRLIARLDAGLDAGRCSLLSAPAGAGKTSLLAAWLAQVDRPVAWLTLDERDQAADQVLRYLVAACQTIAPGCGRRALAWLDAPQPPRPEVVVTELVNDLAALPAPSVSGPGRLPRRARPGRARRGRLPARSPATGAAPGDRQPRGPAAAPAAAARPPPARRGAGGRSGLQRRGGGRVPGRGPGAAAARGAGGGAGRAHRGLGGRAAAGRAGPARPARPGGVRGRLHRRAPAGGRLPAGRGAGAPAAVDPTLPAGHQRARPAVRPAVRRPAGPPTAPTAGREPGGPGGAGAGEPVPGAAGRRTGVVPLSPPVRRRAAGPPGPGGRPGGGGRPAPAGQRLVRPGRAAAGGDRPRAGRRRRRGRRDLDRGADAHDVRDHEHPPGAGGLAGGAARAGRARPAAALPGAGLAADPPGRAGTRRRLDRRGRTRAPRRRRRRPPRARRGRRHARLPGHRRAGHGAGSGHGVGGAGAGRPRAGRRGLPRHRRHQPGAGRARVGPARPGRTGLRGRPRRRSGRPAWSRAA